MDKAEIKKLLLQSMVEKKEYDKLADTLDRDDQRANATKMVKLMEPISLFAELLVENTEGAFADNVMKVVDEETKKALDTLVDDIATLKAELTNELRDTFDSSKSDLIADTLEKYTQTKAELEDKLVSLATEIVSAKASEVLPGLADSARLTEDEINDIIDAAALQVESQMTNVVGAYIVESNVTPDQITGFAEAVRKLLPAERQVTWNDIVGKPEMSQGGTSAYLVKRMIDEALADLPTGSSLPDQTGNNGKFLTTNGTAASWATLAGGGDMLAATYDPANGARQVAFQDELSSGGIVRSVVVTSGSATVGSAAGTDYVYMIAGAHTMSLPAASGNTNLYIFKNNHSANVTIDTVGAETIDGTASISIAPEESVQVISNGTNYFIV